MKERSYQDNINNKLKQLTKATSKNKIKSAICTKIDPHSDRYCLVNLYMMIYVQFNAQNSVEFIKSILWLWHILTKCALNGPIHHGIDVDYLVILR